MIFVCAKWGDKLLDRLEGRAAIQRGRGSFLQGQSMWTFYLEYRWWEWPSARSGWVWARRCAVRGAAAFFLSLVANLCAESNLWCPRCFVVWFIKRPEDTQKQLQLRPAEVSHSLVLAAWFHGVSSRAVAIKTRAVGLAPFITAAHGWQVHPLSTVPCPLLPFLPVLLYSLSLASQSAFLFLVACLQTGVT